jgi:hypothetical protein
MQRIPCGGFFALAKTWSQSSFPGASTSRVRRPAESVVVARVQFVRRRPKTLLVVVELHEVGLVGGRGRTRKSSRPGASGVIELTPFEFLDRLAALIPPPRRHRHRYHGVFALNHPLRPAVTAVAIGNLGKQRDAKTGEHACVSATASSGCCGSAGTIDGKYSTTRHGLPWRSCWHVWVRSFHRRVPGAVVISG